MAKIKVPLEIVEIDPGSYHIFITCSINGHECEMLIDTGASRTVFDMSYFTEASDKFPADEILSSGVSPGNIQTNAGILKKFSLGNKTWKNIQAVFMDLGHINELYKKISTKNIAGLIGGDFLVKAKAKISYEDHTFKLKISSRTRNIFI